MIKRLVYLACCWCLGFVALADEQAPTFNSTDLGDGLVLLQGQGGNILLSHGVDGLLIVDDDYASMAPLLKQEIEAFGGLGQLKYIVNTHWHGDHTGGNDALGEGAAIVAHSNVRNRLNSRQELAFFGMVSEPAARHALPSLTFEQGMNMHFNNERWELIHYPSGHTDGDTVVFLENANLVHMGDHMFYPMFPFVDLGSGGNVLSFAANVGDVLDRVDDATRILPGHGPVTDKQGLAGYHAMLLGTIAEVRAMKASGKSLQQAQEQGLGEQWSSWGSGFIKEPDWINFIYSSLE